MSGRNSKMLNEYAKITNKLRREVKLWWRSLSDKDKCKSRREITVLIEAHNRDLREKAAKAAA